MADLEDDSELEADLFGEIPGDVLERYLEGGATDNDKQVVARAAKKNPDLREALVVLREIDDEAEESIGADREITPPPWPLTELHLDEPDDPVAEWKDFKAKWPVAPTPIVPTFGSPGSVPIKPTSVVESTGFSRDPEQLRSSDARSDSVADHERKEPIMNEIFSQSEGTRDKALVPAKESNLVERFPGEGGTVTVIDRHRRFTKKKLVAATGGTLLLVVAAAVFAVPIVSDAFRPLAEHEVLTQEAWSAWGTFELAEDDELVSEEELRTSLEAALKKAQKCIVKYSAAAGRLQDKLESEGTEIPVGHVGYFTKRRIFKNGLLNDIATCYWLQARSLEELHEQDDPKTDRLERAKEVYQLAAELTHGRCYDAELGTFWSPSQDARDCLERLANKGDE